MIPFNSQQVSTACREPIKRDLNRDHRNPRRDFAGFFGFAVRH